MEKPYVNRETRETIENRGGAKNPWSELKNVPFSGEKSQKSGVLTEEELERAKARMVNIHPTSKIEAKNIKETIEDIREDALVYARKNLQDYSRYNDNKKYDRILAQNTYDEIVDVRTDRIAIFKFLHENGDKNDLEALYEREYEEAIADGENKEMAEAILSRKNATLEAILAEREFKQSDEVFPSYNAKQEFCELSADGMQVLNEAGFRKKAKYLSSAIREQQAIRKTFKMSGMEDIYQKLEPDAHLISGLDEQADLYDLLEGLGQAYQEKYGHNLEY